MRCGGDVTSESETADLRYERDAARGTTAISDQWTAAWTSGTRVVMPALPPSENLHDATRKLSFGGWQIIRDLGPRRSDISRWVERFSRRSINFITVLVADTSRVRNGILSHTFHPPSTE